MEAGATIALFAFLGVCAGALHFNLLRRSVALAVTNGSGLGAVAVTLIRFALTSIFFALAAIFHGVAVLWMLAGFVAARYGAVRIVRAEA